MPPCPSRWSHMDAPLWSGSRAWTTPDFCPAIRTCLPFGSARKIAEDPKSRSGPFDSGQLVEMLGVQARLNASLAVNWCDHNILPVFRFSATTASLVFEGGSESLSPVVA